ncbi:MAG: metallophosphoesterase [bacterium]|nr:metallophosphoesterase [bacterium]
MIKKNSRFLGIILSICIILSLVFIPANSAMAAVSGLSGSGTKASPYLIDTASDFLEMAENYGQIGSNGNYVYFLQTADINLGNSYAGTDAYSSSKQQSYLVYNGAGHSITASLSKNTQYCSLFPYTYGVVMNTNFIVSSTGTQNSNFQVIRTFGTNGNALSSLLVNCSFDYSNNVATTFNGIAYSFYGTAYRLYVKNSDSQYIYSTVTGINNEVYNDSYTFSAGQGGAVNNGSSATPGTARTNKDNATLVEKFNRRAAGNSATVAVSAINTFLNLSGSAAAYTEADIKDWQLSEGNLSVGKNDGGIPDESESGQVSDLSVEYEFAGENKDVAGYAQGTVTIIPGENSYSSGYYKLFWATDSALLQNYSEIATLNITGSTVTYTMVKGMAIPKDATKLVVFECLSSDQNVFDFQSGIKFDIPEKKRFIKNEVELKFASVSDVHVNYSDYGGPQKWTAALNYYNNLDMDLVVISGDMTNSSLTSEYEIYKNASLASDYPYSRIYEGVGNHDSQNDSIFASYTSGGNAYETESGPYAEVHPYDNSPYYYIIAPSKVEGGKNNLFIFMAQDLLTSTSNTASQDNFSNEQIAWLSNMLATFAAREDYNVFVVQHALIKDFSAGDRLNGKGKYSEPMIANASFPNNLRFKQLMCTYTDVVWMSGHTHLSFAEMVNYVDTDENGDPAARMIHNSSVSQPRGYTNSSSISYNNNGKTTYSTGSEGYSVYVYNSDIVYCGTNLTTGKIIPTACYIMSTNSSHVWRQSSVIDPTYTSEGLKKYTCGHCTETKDEVIPKLIWVSSDNKVLVGTDNGNDVFVDKSVISAKVQLPYRISSSDSKTSIRLLSTVSTLDLQAAGFMVSVEIEKGVWKDLPMPEQTGVYSKVFAGDRGVTPVEVSGCQDSAYIFCIEISNIAKNYFNKNIKITPFWRTQQGITVAGDARTITVNSLMGIA